MKVAFPFVRIYRVLGQRWTDQGWLQQPEDVFFLTIPGVERIIQAGDPASADLDLRALVAGRRKAYEYWFTIEAPEIIGPDGRPIVDEPTDQPTGAILQGIAASGGQARGAARIIQDPREATRLETSHILVTRATDPGWTPVFPLVGGLVLEVDGQLSHGAIVARSTACRLWSTSTTPPGAFGMARSSLLMARPGVFTWTKCEASSRPLHHGCQPAADCLLA